MVVLSDYILFKCKEMVYEYLTFLRNLLAKDDKLRAVGECGSSTAPESLICKNIRNIDYLIF